LAYHYATDQKATMTPPWCHPTVQYIPVLPMSCGRYKELIAQAVAKATGQTPPRENTQILRLAKRPRQNDPEIYDGKAENFRTWWTSLAEHLGYINKDFDEDGQRIAWVGGLLRDKALRWHQERRAQMVRLGVQDAWSSYEGAIRKAFIDSFEGESLIRKMRDLSNQGDMQDFITRIKFFNARVGLTGIPYWEVVKAGRGREMYTRYSLGARATSDMDLEQRLLEVGKSYGESLQEAKALGLKNPQLFESQEETGKGKEQRKGDKYTPSPAKAGPSATNA
jgi:hypothetical protein